MTEAIADPIQLLLDAGFVKDLTTKQWTDANAEATRAGMGNGGDYRLDYLLRRGDVTVQIEQNVSTLVQDGLETMTRHPAVAVVVGPRGRVACPANDTALILSMADSVA